MVTRVKQSDRPKVAAIYCRVSTDGQEDNSSLDDQERSCRLYATEQGYDVSAVYRDVWSGFDLWERPKLTLLRDAARAGEVDAIIMFDPDRMSRRQSHAAILVDEWERLNVALQFVAVAFDKSAMGEFLRSARAFAAELEREKIRERTMRGKLARVRGGKLLPGNRPPYGYAWADDTKAALIVAEDTALIVRSIFEKVASGETLRQVARDLEAADVPTPNGGMHWAHSVIRELIVNERYKGVAIGNRTVYTKVAGRARRTLRPIEEHVTLPDGLIPPLVSPEEWELAQERVKRNKAQAVRNNRNPEAYLLRAGFVRCASCGNLANTAWHNNGCSKTKNPIYRIGNRACGHADCPTTVISARKLDAAIWGRVVELITHPEVIAAELARMADSDTSAADLVTVDRALDDVARKQANIGRGLGLLDDQDAAAPLLAELKVLAERRRQLAADREGIARRAAAYQAKEAQLLSIQEWAGTVAQNAAAMTYQQKRDLLTALKVEVMLYPLGHTPRWTMTTDLSGVCIVEGSSISSSP